MLVLGIDPGAHTGWAVLRRIPNSPRTWDLVQHGTFDHPTVSQMDGLVWRVHGIGNLEVLAIEDQHLKLPNVVKQLSYQRGQWAAVAELAGVTKVVSVYPAQWQRSYVWDGPLPRVNHLSGAEKRAARKTWTATYIKAAAESFGVDGLTEDESAAAFIALWAAERIDGAEYDDGTGEA